MATREGLLTVEFESTPRLLAAVSQVLDECNDGDIPGLSAEVVASLRDRVEGLEWAPPPDQETALVNLAATALCALANLPRRPVTP